MKLTQEERSIVTGILLAMNGNAIGLDEALGKIDALVDMKLRTYAPTEPQAPTPVARLMAEEASYLQAQTCGGAAGASEGAPALDAGLVRKANDAYFGAGIAAAATFPYTDDQVFRMANAVRVVADALLADTTAEEVLAFRKWFPLMPDPIAATFDCYIGFRRARLLTSVKSATIQEQVEHILTKHFKTIGVVDAAAEVIATLKREGK